MRDQKHFLIRFIYAAAWLVIALLAVNILVKGYNLYIKGDIKSQKQDENQMEAFSDTLLRGLLPIVFSGEKDDSESNFMEKAVSFLENSLFPISGALNDGSQDVSARVEYYPSAEDLEAEYKSYQESESLMAVENQEAAQTAEEESGEGTTAQEDQSGGENTVPAMQGTVYPMESLRDYSFLMNNFFVVDATTEATSDIIDGSSLLAKDLTMDLSGEEPKILIYHTHSQEAYIDSEAGNPEDTVVGMGSLLASYLQDKYGISVIHNTDSYDVVDGKLDRDKAYTMAGVAVEQILAENPSIKVVIDLHRDGVPDTAHLVTDINGKETAQFMFFNGLCRGAVNGEIGYLQNPYRSENLAFSLKMQLKAAELYPGLTRKIYLKPYRYNQHFMPRSLLIELGAQTNTVEEARNAMEPLADILYQVLSGQ